ncbi:MAG TPA: TIGR00296 family protein [Thermoplasmatales archaeon]|nr:TIGR00296 family protein [Thermoplasmatales archaeon]
MVSQAEGEKLVKYARNVIENHVRGYEIGEIENFDEKGGVFVTIHKYPSMHLRGCIGIPEPLYPLKKAIKESAISACHDPRFPDLREEELDEIVVEVTILTPPEIIKGSPSEYKKNIEIGRDGLIAERGFYRGLLLPQVPVEYKWNEEEFLRNTCIKAGLLPDAWMNENVKIYKFQGEIFAEEEPHGKIKKIELHA